MERRQRTRLEAVGILALVFGSGLALGVAGHRSFAASPTAEAAEEPQERTKGESERERERRPPLYRQVGELSDPQQTAIDSVLREHRGAMKALQREFSEAYDPRYWAIVENTRKGISAVMTPEQAARYDSLLAEADRKRFKNDDDRSEDGKRD